MCVCVGGVGVRMREREAESVRNLDAEDFIAFQTFVIFPSLSVSAETGLSR